LTRNAGGPPAINLQIARAYLTASDPQIATRTSVKPGLRFFLFWHFNSKQGQTPCSINLQQSNRQELVPMFAFRTRWKDTMN
ncbi:MAG: hypothetical protein ACLQAN_08935, partial [Acidimicrobiales bacterium]